MPKGGGKGYKNTDRYKGYSLAYPKDNSPMQAMDPKDREAWNRKWHILPKDGIDRREVARRSIMNKKHTIQPLKAGR